MPSLVRVSLGIATYNRDTFDWSTKPKVSEVLSQFEAFRHGTFQRVAGIHRCQQARLACIEWRTGDPLHRQVRHVPGAAKYDR